MILEQSQPALAEVIFQGCFCVLISARILRAFPRLARRQVALLFGVPFAQLAPVNRRMVEHH